MHELKELIFFIDKHLGKKAALAREKKASKLQQLYEGTLSNTWSGDEAAFEALYAHEGESPSAYRKLKMTLKNRLIELLFSINLKQSDSTDRQKASFTCYKEWAAAKLLLSKNVRVNGIELCSKVLKDAMKFEFSDLCRDASATLRIHYGTIEGDERKFNYYNDLYKKYNYLCQKEELAEEYFTYLTIHYVNVRKLDAAIHENAKTYYQELKADLQQHHSYRLHLYGRLVQMTIYRSINDYQETLNVCKAAIDFFKEKAYTANAPLQIFYYEMFETYINLKNYEEAIKIAKILDKYIEPGIFNWFKYQELSFLLFTHTKRYQEAFQVFQSVTNNNQFQFLPTHVTETWKIFEAYLSFLLKTNVLQLSTPVTLKFKVGKFLNEIEVFSKDKAGMNIAILIAQLLFSILQKEHGDAADQVEAINKYCARHLAYYSARRSYCFIKMLLQIPLNHYRYSDIVKKTASLLQELHSFPLQISSQSLEVEIIPYEALWDIVLSTLDANNSLTGHRNTN